MGKGVQPKANDRVRDAGAARDIIQLSAGSFSFTVPGAPRGKGRPRSFGWHDKKSGKVKVRAYTPAETASYENLIALAARAAGVTPIDGPVQIIVNAWLLIPKSARKRDIPDMISGQLRPLKKPDGDNIMKAVLDGLNKVAFTDDVQAVDQRIRKWWTPNNPRLEVEVRAWRPPMEVSR